MNIKEIIEKMNEVINDAAMASDVRRKELESLAKQLWSTLLPDSQMGEYHKALKNNGDKWNPVRTIIDEYENKDLLYRVADWPASGGDLSTCKKQ